MKKILFVAVDSGNPISSGFDAAERWAKQNAPKNYYITSHCLGSYTNRYQVREDRFVYEVCVDISCEAG